MSFRRYEHWNYIKGAAELVNINQVEVTWVLVEKKHQNVEGTEYRQDDISNSAYSFN